MLAVFLPTLDVDAALVPLPPQAASVPTPVAATAPTPAICRNDLRLTVLLISVFLAGDRWSELCRAGCRSMPCGWSGRVSLGAREVSALDGAGEHALAEEALEEGERDGDRDDRDHHEGHELHLR